MLITLHHLCHIGLLRFYIGICQIRYLLSFTCYAWGGYQFYGRFALQFRKSVMDNKTKIRKKDNENLFREVEIIKIWIVSTVFWFCFPVFFVLCYLAMGQVRTKQLVIAFVHDFLQTLFLIFIVECVILYAGYYFVSNLF